MAAQHLLHGCEVSLVFIVLRHTLRVHSVCIEEKGRSIADDAAMRFAKRGPPLIGVVREMTTRTLLFAIGSAAIASSFAVAGPVPGTTIDLEFRTSGPARPVLINYIFGADADAAARAGGSYGYAGFLNWTNGLKSFCVQIKEDIPAGVSVEFTFANLEDVPDDPPYSAGMGLVRAAMLRDLYSRWWSVVDTAGEAATADSDLCAAFQVMIWEISHETLPIGSSTEPGELEVDALALNRGAVQVNNMTTEAASYFDQMLASLGGSKRDTWLDHLGDSLWGLTNPDYQDQILVVPGAGAAFAGLGLVGLRRRRRR